MHPCDDFARKIRRAALRMVQRGGGSHAGSCMSVADILAVLYSDVLRVDPARPDWPARDRFIMSKGHAAAALYAALALRGFLPPEELRTFYQDGTRLVGHVTHTKIPGVELSTGSLGHGLPVACGMALYGKRHALPYRVFVVMSDGECDEGSNWEAALFAGHHGLAQLTAVIDYNRIQSMGRVDEVLRLDPLGEKWRAFQWTVREVDGHSTQALKEAIDQAPEGGRPTCVIAHTIKGKGVSFMEDKLLWHYRVPTPTDLQQALEELGGDGADGIF